VKAIKVLGYLAILIAGVLTVGSDASSAMGSPLRKQCEEWLHTFFRLPADERISAFQNYGVEDKYSIYICGSQVRHPPDTYLAEPFALEGKKAVDFLIPRLSAAKDDPTICDIVRLLLEINRQKTYDVAGDKAAMKCITEGISRIKNDAWKGIAQDWVREIVWSKGYRP
jgi:hypothetical protein